MIYCDTSVLISALTAEPRSLEVQRWLTACSVDSLAISPWVNTEFASAIAIKCRTGDVRPDDGTSILKAWAAMMPSFLIVPFEANHFRAAAALLSRPGVKLRAGDALHLTIAHDHGFDLATLDRGLARAAEVLAVRIAPILTSTEP